MSDNTTAANIRLVHVALRVNGEDYNVQALVDSPLLYVLRNQLGLSGPRFGCGAGDCGTCGVLLDGREIRSCNTPISEVRGEVTTIEGLPRLWATQNNLPDLESDDVLHPVQQAWIDEQVPQCGYCQSGMMIAAVDLLNRRADPSPTEIKVAFSVPNPHLCRCGTYAAVIRAVQRAAKGMV